MAGAAAERMDNNTSRPRARMNQHRFDHIILKALLSLLGRL